MLEQDFIDKILNDTNPNNCQDENLNIGDIVEAIQTTDPVTAQVMFDPHHVPPSNGEILSPTRSVPRTSRRGDHSSKYKNAYVVITEQPASKALRFRYECEGRCAGSIPGVNSSPENKTFPSIQVIGFKGKAFVKVSCVTKDKPYRAHPHNLVGKEGCDKGICTVEINSNTMSVSFSSLGIQCVKKRDIAEALRIREEIKVDPYGNGFSHQAQPSSLDLNSVRLCFQVFLKSDQFAVPLKPVVSDPIFDKKAMSDLVICKLSDASCTVAGGKEMILLCEKVAKEDIAVRFFEERNGLLYWEHYGEFSHNDVHKQVAIYFRTPKYKTLEVEHTIKCFIQLKRPSDGVTSEPLPFEYLPLDSDPIVLKRKRIESGNETRLYQQLVDHNQQQYDSRMANQNLTDKAIKTEPRDNCTSPYRMYTNVTPKPDLSPLHSSTTTSYYQQSNIQPNSSSFFDAAEYYQNCTSHQLQSPHQQQQEITNNFNITGCTSSQSNTLFPLLNNLSNIQNNNQILSVVNVPVNNDNMGDTEMNSDNLRSLFNLDSNNLIHANTEELAGLFCSSSIESLAPINITPINNSNNVANFAPTNMDQEFITDSFTRIGINDLNKF